MVNTGTLSRRDAAVRLDISLEMARRHGIATRISEAQLAELEQNPPAWLSQSRSNRTGKKAVWVSLTCDVCGFSEQARPKKWWPTFSYITCEHHRIGELPEPRDGFSRTELDGIGSRFVGIVDTADGDD